LSSEPSAYSVPSRSVGADAPGANAMSHTPSLGWAPSTALRPCVSISLVIAYSLYILSSPQRYRLKHLAVIFLLGADYFQRLHDLYPDDHVNQAFAHGVLIHLLHMVHVVVLRRDDGYITTTSVPPDHSSAEGSRLLSKTNLSPSYRAYKMVFNFRGIGTSWQAIPTQHRLFPAQQQNGNGRKLSLSQYTSQGQQDSYACDVLSRRWDDLLHRLFSILCRYLAAAIYYEITEPRIHIWSQALVLRQAQPFSSSLLSPTEMTARAYFTLHFIFHQWLLLSSFHECLSIICIYILRLDDPHEWPSLFGNIFAAYTVRGFWANYWHRLVYAPFRALADALSAQVWGRKNNVARRLVNNALVFLLSSVLHSIIDWERGLCNPSASGIFYALQPVGFIVESLVQYYVWGPIRRRLLSLSRGTNTAVPAPLVVFETILGYGWVWIWFYWLVPYCIISELQCNSARMEALKVEHKQVL